MGETKTTDATPATSAIADAGGLTGAEGNLSASALSDLFMGPQAGEAADVAPAPEAEAEKEVAGEPEGVEETPDQPEEAQAEDDTESESADSEEAEADPDLSQFSEKAQRKIQKRIDRLTREKKETEERLQAVQAKYDARLEQLEARLQQREEVKGELSLQERIDRITEPNELQKLYNEARETKRWADRHARDEVVEISGRELSADEVLAIKEAAEDALERDIPKRVEFLRAKAHWDAKAAEFFPGLDDPSTEFGQSYRALMSNEKFANVFKELPDVKIMIGGFLAWAKAVRDGAGRTAPKKTAAPKKAPPVVTDASAPASRPAESQKLNPIMEAGAKRGALSQAEVAEFFTQR